MYGARVLLVRRWVLPLFCVWIGVCSACKDVYSFEPSGPAAGLSEVPDLASQVDWAALEVFWKRSMQLPGIDTGPKDSAKQMLLFFDPDCPVCARQWRVMRPYLDRVHIHWIPVAYINATSLRRAAAILSDHDPVSALEQNEEDYDFRQQKGGLKIPPIVPTHVLDMVRTNTKVFMQQENVAVTPMLGFELYPQKRYYRVLGLMDASSMKRAVDALGHTMDPWHPSRAE